MQHPGWGIDHGRPSCPRMSTWVRCQDDPTASCLSMATIFQRACPSATLLGVCLFSVSCRSFRLGLLVALQMILTCCVAARFLTTCLDQSRAGGTSPSPPTPWAEPSRSQSPWSPSLTKVSTHTHTHVYFTNRGRSVFINQVGPLFLVILKIQKHNAKFFCHNKTSNLFFIFLKKLPEGTWILKQYLHI